MIEDPPPVHGPAAGDKQVWATETDCYDFLARHVESGSRTLETGCGISTALFTLWGAEHTCVVYSQEEADILSAWAQRRGVDTARLNFEIGPSDDVLPRLEPTELDLVLVDGSHAFPAPIIDWFYAAGRLRDQGIVVLDDLQLAAAPRSDRVPGQGSPLGAHRPHRQVGGVRPPFRRLAARGVDRAAIPGRVSPPGRSPTSAGI